MGKDVVSRSFLFFVGIFRVGAPNSLVSKRRLLGLELRVVRPGVVRVRSLSHVVRGGAVVHRYTFLGRNAVYATGVVTSIGVRFVAIRLG